jgi:hypothetical protein
MKRMFYLFAIMMFLSSCKKQDFAPEGPTDVRIRNLSDQNFTEVSINTSEYPEDVLTIASLQAGATSEYHRFKKAYPKAQITAKINSEGSIITLSTPEEEFTYMQYMSTMRITFEVYISNLDARELKINRVIPEEELILE